jgi:hypothetical protein
MDLAMAKVANLISPDMLRLNQMLHDSPKGFGGSGWKHWENIIAFCNELHVVTLLDYGCGECTLGRQLNRVAFPVTIREYDPAVRRRAKLPEPCDMVVCTDVLEHVEPDKLQTVLKHIYSLAKKGVYLAIATRPANKLLPDGRNAHLIIEDTPWWRERVKSLPWKIQREHDVRKGSVPEGAPHEVRYWITKG